MARSLYATVPDLLTIIGIDASETANVVRAKRSLIDISDLIDMWVGGHFYTWEGIRAFSATGTSELRTPQLLAVTTLKTDDGTRTYGTTWATTDYDLEPENAPYLSPPWPYDRIRIRSTGSYSFGADVMRGALVTGRFGQYDVRESLTTLAAAINSSVTTLTAPTGKLKVGQTIRIDSEQILIDAVTVAATDTATVIRGLNGTTAASHLINAPIQVYTYPLIEQACLIQAHRSYRRADTPFGVQGEAGAGMIWIRELDPDVKERLNMFRIPGGMGR